MARQWHWEPAKEKRMNNHNEHNNNSSLDLIMNRKCFYMCVYMSAYIYIHVSADIYVDWYQYSVMHSSYIYVPEIFPALKMCILKKSESQQGQENYSNSFNDSIEVIKGSIQLLTLWQAQLGTVVSSNRRGWNCHVLNIKRKDKKNQSKNFFIFPFQNHQSQKWN